MLGYSTGDKMKNRKYIVCYLVILLIASIPLLNNYLILYNKGTHILENIHNFTFVAEKRLACVVSLRGGKG